MGSNRLSEEYKDKIKKKYKFSKTAWIDSSGLVFIGFNTRTDKDDSRVLSRKTAEDLFKKDIKRIQTYLNRRLGKKIPENHYEILVALCYDVGTKALSNSLFFNLYLIGDISESFRHYLSLGRVNGQVSSSFLKRRKEELYHIKYNIEGH